MKLPNFLTNQMRPSLLLALCIVPRAFAQDVCTVNGPEGPCTLSPPFIGGEWNDGKGGVDPDGKSCNKFKNTVYQGSCKGGALDGLVLLRRPFDKRVQNTGGHQYILHIDAGIVRFPIAEYTTNGFQNRWAYDRSGCLLFFGTSRCCMKCSAGARRLVRVRGQGSSGFHGAMHSYTLSTWRARNRAW